MAELSEFTLPDDLRWKQLWHKDMMGEVPDLERHPHEAGTVFDVLLVCLFVCEVVVVMALLWPKQLGV